MKTLAKIAVPLSIISASCSGIGYQSTTVAPVLPLEREQTIYKSNIIINSDSTKTCDKRNKEIDYFEIRWNILEF